MRCRSACKLQKLSLEEPAMASRAIKLLLFFFTSAYAHTYAQAQWTVAVPPPPPPTVYVQPTPPPIIVVPSMQGVPPDSIVVQQPSPLTYHSYYRPIERTEPLWPSTGLKLTFTGGFGSKTRLLGGTAALRYRASRTFGLDIGGGYLVGHDEVDRKRREIPLFVDGLIYLIPRQPIQLYLVAGAHAAWSHAEGVRSDTGFYDNADGFYVGGQGGLGIEFQLHPYVYLTLDVRATLRNRVSGSAAYDFIEHDEQGRPTGRTTNWSSGIVGNAGLLFYF